MGMLGHQSGDDEEGALLGLRETEHIHRHGIDDWCLDVTDLDGSDPGDVEVDSGRRSCRLEGDQPPIKPADADGVRSEVDDAGLGVHTLSVAAPRPDLTEVGGLHSHQDGWSTGDRGCRWVVSQPPNWEVRAAEFPLVTAS